MPRLRKGEVCRREKWRADVLRAKKLPSSTRMFLVSVLAPHMKADGFVSVPRHLLADEMGVDERTITRHFTKAREAGWLVSLRVGHRGLTAEYHATWPTSQRGTTSVPLSLAERGTETNPLSRDNLVPLWGRRPSTKGDTWCPATSSYFVTTAVGVPHDTRSCGCDECATWRYVMYPPIGRLVGLELVDSSNSKTQPRSDERARA